MEFTDNDLDFNPRICNSSWDHLFPLHWYIYMYIHTSVSLYYIRLTEIKLDLCCLMRCGLAVVVVVLIGEHQLTHMSTENPELITHVDVRKRNLWCHWSAFAVVAQRSLPPVVCWVLEQGRNMGKCPQQQESTKSGGSQTLNEYNKPEKPEQIQVGTEDVFSFYFPGFHLFGIFFGGLQRRQFASLGSWWRLPWSPLA